MGPVEPMGLLRQRPGELLRPQWTVDRGLSSGSSELHRCGFRIVRRRRQQRGTQLGRRNRSVLRLRRWDLPCVARTLGRMEDVSDARWRDCRGSSVACPADGYGRGWSRMVLRYSSIRLARISIRIRAQSRDVRVGDQHGRLTTGSLGWPNHRLSIVESSRFAARNKPILVGLRCVSRHTATGSRDKPRARGGYRAAPGRRLAAALHDGTLASARCRHGGRSDLIMRLIFSSKASMVYEGIGRAQRNPIILRTR